MTLKGDTYETVEEANMRLTGSVVLYDGDPVYVTNVTGVDNVDEGGGKDIFRVYATPLPFNIEKDIAGGKEIRKYISSKKFNLSAFKLGYCNLGYGKAVFLSRVAMRQNRQGLTGDTLRIRSISDNNPTDVGFKELVASKGFVSCIKGIYPNYKEFDYEEKAEGLTSMALSRNIALQKDEEGLGLIYAYHRGVKCGYVKDGGRLFISNKFKFLKEEFEESLIPLA